MDFCGSIEDAGLFEAIDYNSQVFETWKKQAL